MLLLETPRRFSRISTLRVSAAWFAFPDRIYTHARRYMHVREESCSHASSMECDTFSCVIKSRVTRALYIIHAATPSTAAFAIAHPPFLFFHVCFPSSRVIFFSFFAHIRSPGLISRGRSARTANILSVCHVRTCAAISSARQDLLAQYLPPPSCSHSRDCFPSSVMKLNFPAGVVLAASGLSFNLLMVVGF